MTRVLLAGTTGLVGSHCLDLLLQAPDVLQVTALTRRALSPPVTSDRLRVAVVDFDKLDAEPSLFAVDAVVCALGTTIRTAGSRGAFRRVDFDYPLDIARRARAAGASHFLLVSALSADASSRIFYSRVKGELEAAITALEYPALTIARPSLLLGDRREFRPGELVGKWLSWMAPRRWRGVHARQVAAALVGAITQPPTGVRVIENAGLLSWPRY